jgi:hypothetical protein
LAGGPSTAEGRDQVIGLHRLAGLQQQFQHPAARGGQALLGGDAARLGGLQFSREGGTGDAVIVVIVSASGIDGPWPRGRGAGPPAQAQ